MSEEDKASGMTIRIPAPRVFGEVAARRPDARTAEVLRALHRAKGTIVEPDPPTNSRSMETLGWELRSLREWLSRTSPIVEEATRRLAATAAVFERAVLVPSEKLDTFQRSHDDAVRDLRETVHALRRQVDALAAWRAWWAKNVAAFCLVIALLLAGGIGLAWRAHTLAKSTHDILAQILENQERARTAKGEKHR
jgi:hypothetical protein